METITDTVQTWQLERDDVTDYGIVTTVVPLANGNWGIYFAEDEDYTEFHPDRLFDLYGMVYDVEV